MISRSIYFIPIILLSLEISLFSQEKNAIDSLLHLVDDDKIDTTQLDINRELAKFYYNVNTKKAIDYYLKSKKLAEILGYPRTIANSNYSLGLCYSTLGNFEKSLEHFLLAARYFEEAQNNRNTSLTYSDIASLYANFKKYDKAFEYYAKAEKLIKLMNDTFEMGYLFQGMSHVYYLQEKYDSAIAINLKTMKLTASLEDKSFLQSAYSNIGLLSKKKKDYNRALLYIDSAFLLSNDDPYTLSGLYNNYGSIYSEQRKIPEAEKAFFKSLELCKLTNNTVIELENYKNLAELYEISSHYKNQALYQLKYYQLKDSLYSEENKLQFNQLESDFQLEKKDKLLAKSNLETTKQKNARNLFLIISLFSASLLALLYTYYKKSQNKNQLLHQQNILIDNQKTELEKLNQVKDRLFSVISHDLRNPLNTLKSYLMLSDNESISADQKLLFKNQTMSAITQTGDLLENLLTWANLQIKNTWTNIVPTSIQECVEDVVSVLEHQARLKNVKINRNVTKIDVPANLDILSIALRNLITNAIKYSHPHGQINIESKSNDNNIQIIVEDFGQGMSAEQLRQILNNQNDSTLGTSNEKGSGLGLYLVKEMLKKINAELFIESKLGKGSQFIIHIPV